MTFTIFNVFGHNIIKSSQKVINPLAHLETTYGIKLNEKAFIIEGLNGIFNIDVFAKSRIDDVSLSM